MCTFALLCFELYCLFCVCLVFEVGGVIGLLFGASRMILFGLCVLRVVSCLVLAYYCDLDFDGLNVDWFPVC